MIFQGISRIFSTENDGQYEAIGAFWDALSERFGRENLLGLGFNWTGSTIEYIIGLKQGDIPADFEGERKRIELPDEGWLNFCGRTEKLSELYDEIYRNGALLYEIEEFDDSGNCRVSIYR